jgi:hypothetical protein
MPKTNPTELKFPAWSETSKYGINTLPTGITVKPHFHDANQFWIIIFTAASIQILRSGKSRARKQGLGRRNELPLRTANLSYFPSAAIAMTAFLLSKYPNSRRT